MALGWIEMCGKQERKNYFPLCYRINSMKIQFRLPVVENVQFFSAAVHRRVPPTFAFLIFYFVKVSCSCVSLRHLKPVNSQQTHFCPIHKDSVNFSHHDTEEKNRFCCDDMLDGNGALLTNNINDVKWKMKLGV